MIEIYFQSSSFFVYKPADWELLRKEHRIIGEPLDNVHSVPVLPLRLLPEECTLLLDKGLACLVQCEYKAPSEENKMKYLAFVKSLYKEEQRVYRNLRKKELEVIIDKIISGKRKRGDDRSKEEILNDELDKSSDISEDTMIWPIFSEDQSFLNKIQLEMPLECVQNYTTPTRVAVYKDLWERGYYITPGAKFGGDFLVYLGDPILFHAVFIVRCVDVQEQIYSTEIVAFGRLGTSVKKKAVLASLIDNTVTYITLRWIDA